MKKLATFILLLCHMNNSMFLPQSPQDDVYDSNGRQMDDISSVFEWVNVELGYDKTADDENDDNGQNFHLVKSVNYTYQQQVITLEKVIVDPGNKSLFAEYDTPSIPSPAYDILTPPPDRA